QRMSAAAATPHGMPPGSHSGRRYTAMAAAATRATRPQRMKERRSSLRRASARRVSSTEARIASSESVAGSSVWIALAIEIARACWELVGGRGTRGFLSIDQETAHGLHLCGCFIELILHILLERAEKSSIVDRVVVRA